MAKNSQHLNKNLRVHRHKASNRMLFVSLIQMWKHIERKSCAFDSSKIGKHENCSPNFNLPAFPYGCGISFGKFKSNHPFEWVIVFFFFHSRIVCFISELQSNLSRKRWNMSWLVESVSVWKERRTEILHWYRRRILDREAMALFIPVCVFFHQY